MQRVFPCDERVASLEKHSYASVSMYLFVWECVVFVVETIYTVGRARGRIYLWRIVRVAAALSPYQETREGGYRPRT